VAREHVEVLPERPTVLLIIPEAKRSGPVPCIEVRFPGPHVELTTAGAAALEDDLRRARLAAVDIGEVDAPPAGTLPARALDDDELAQLARAAGVDPYRRFAEVFPDLLARVQQLREIEPF
jgi:hypothetical protein